MVIDRLSRISQRYIERAHEAKTAELYAYWVNRPISQGTVLYEAGEGTAVTGSPGYLFRYLIEQNDQKNLMHIWSVSDDEQLASLAAEFSPRGNVKFVRRGGPAYFRALATSQYLINDQEFPKQFLKRAEQTFIHTSDIASDGSEGVENIECAAANRNVFRNLLAADYLVSNSSSNTERFLMGKFRLHNIFDGKIIEIKAGPENPAGLVPTTNLGISLTETDRSKPTHELASSRRNHIKDDQAAKRVVDIVFRNCEQSYVRGSSKDARSKVLLYPGGMVPNGITTSALNLLHNIDYERFDVTVVCPFSDDETKQRMIDQIDSKARVVFRDGRFAGGLVVNKMRSLAMLGSIFAKQSLGKRYGDLWSREWQRCFGGSSFDHVIDFSGYSPFWGELFRHGKSGSRTIWLHNDLAADSERVIHGRKPHHRNLQAVFRSYCNFDNLVSVSEHLRDINSEKLSEWAPAHKFTFARNTLNLERIRSLAGPALGATHSQETPDDQRPFRFVTVGRLSPEKNHARLISAFSVVHGNNAKSRLVIVGDGPLMADLRSQVANLGLSSAITFTGHVDNPYAHMKEADVFVLSSDYEGQPMVLLEALVVGLPVITTAFGSVEGALPKGTGTIVERNVGALAAAMHQIQINEPSGCEFDGEAYNHEALKEFEDLFDGKS